VQDLGFSSPGSVQDLLAGFVSTTVNIRVTIKGGKLVNPTFIRKRDAN
jgi:hypothetical protein